MKLLIKRLFSLWPFRYYICWHGRRGSGKVALTFDDGPRENYTKKVLDILRAENVLATFFVEGRWVEKSPQLVKEIIDAGHEIGNHGYDHGATGVLMQMKKGDKELSRYGIVPRIFRPALGRVSLKEIITILLEGKRIVLWSFDTHDSMRHEGKWREKDPDYSLIQRGDIILMHDDNPVCINELTGLIRAVKERGLTFVRMAELF